MCSQTNLQALVPELVTTLKRNLAEDFVALLTFSEPDRSPDGAGIIPAPFVLILGPQAQIAPLRAAFFPIWEAYQPLLKRPPLTLRLSDLEPLWRLDPLLAEHWLHHGRPHAADGFSLPDLSLQIEAVTRQAAVAEQIWEASRALCAPIIEPAKQATRQVALERLAPGQIRPPASLLADLTAPFDSVKKTALPPESPPFGLEGLVALYENMGDLIVVLRQAADFEANDWPAVAVELANLDYESIVVTTAGLFSLMLPERRPLDVKLFSYRLSWGIDLLTDLSLSRHKIMQQAGKIPLHINLDDFTSVCLSHQAGEEIDRKIIHDFQNKLLNIRLQNELLARLQMSDKVAPAALPDRHAPHNVRLDGIWNQFSWWLAYYDRLAQTAAAA